MNIFVGNLPNELTNAGLKELFSRHGTVAFAKVMRDWDTGDPKGFGFVEMPDIEEAKMAITMLNKKEFRDNVLIVSVAKPRE